MNFSKKSCSMFFVFWGQYICALPTSINIVDTVVQEPGFIDDQESVAFNFEDADLANVASYMENIHNVSFITEDVLPTVKDAKGLAGHKVTFKTNKFLTKRESWNLFITFLRIAGLDLVPMAQAGFYKIVPFAKAISEPVPTYIGVDPTILPDSDMVVRYVYFVQNVDPAKMQNLLLKFQAGSAKLEVFAELRALIFHDRANNIKSLMEIALEIERSAGSDSVLVFKIKQMAAADVKTLYESLQGGGKSLAGQPQQLMTSTLSKKVPLDYFPKDVKLLVDNRTNSLILLGPDKSIKKVVEFVENYIDIDSTRAIAPIFTYQLAYTNAADIVAILQTAISYGSTTPAGKYGGVRDDIKYFSPMTTLVADPRSNSIIINASKDDYEALVPLIKELDTPQKQVGIEVLIVQITDSQAKALGSQLSGPNGPDAPIAAHQQAQTFAQNITGQVSGVLGVNGQSTAPVVVQTTTASGNTSYSLKASLGALLGQTYSAVVGEPGSILVTFGQPIWALFKMLQSMVTVHLVANPFVVTSNNVPAQISISQLRRILVSQSITVGGTVTNSLTNANSLLGFTITPQINKGNIINLAINITNNRFLAVDSSSSALQSQKNIVTNASVANGEVLVIGGLMQEQYSSTSRGVPFLEHIPIFGWFFKSKVKTIDKSHFLVFISPRIIEPAGNKAEGMDSYTLYKMQEAHKKVDILNESDWFASRRDPIQTAFFEETMPERLQTLTQLKSDEKFDQRNLACHNAKKIVVSKMRKSRSKVGKKIKNCIHDTAL